MLDKEKFKRYIQIQNYFQDEWVNTNHKTYEDVLNEAKQFGFGELKSMHIGSSWFEHDTFFYIDKCGHYVLFRGVTGFNDDKLSNKKVNVYGNEDFCYESIEEDNKENVNKNNTMS